MSKPVIAGSPSGLYHQLNLAAYGLARVNAGTNLERSIEDGGVGRVYAGHSVDELERLAEELADDDALRHSRSERGTELDRWMFSPAAGADGRAVGSCCGDQLRWKVLVMVVAPTASELYRWPLREPRLAI
jgi:hypothetical protein